MPRLHPAEEFESYDDLYEFQRRLADELEKGTIERVPVGRLEASGNPEEWYREKDTGIVYRFSPPEFPLTGTWARIEDPDARSYFAELCPVEEPSQEEYARLSAELEKRWLCGEIERAPDVDTPLKGVMLYHHAPTDETYELTPPGEMKDEAMWRKVFRTQKGGNWPGELKKDIPPTQRSD